MTPSEKMMRELERQIAEKVNEMFGDWDGSIEDHPINHAAYCTTQDVPTVEEVIANIERVNRLMAGVPDTCEMTRAVYRAIQDSSEFRFDNVAGPMLLAMRIEISDDVPSPPGYRFKKCGKLFHFSDSDDRQN